MSTPEHAAPGSTASGDAALRLLPWTTPEGNPCYLLPDPDGDGPVARMADETEELQLAMGAELLTHAEKMTAPAIGAGAGELRYLAGCLASALRDALRIAESRARR